ncbi:MAG: TetR/AcrR family transcriptional regulator, partial [Actinobacteria bacterium]|nr:TetR/AcrR family transcriptional regulator [Actinomycetota bacterium]
MSGATDQDGDDTGSETRRSRAERSENTRRRLLDVARALFAERGYDATPIEEILARTGLSKGAFYHHFPDKRELLAAVYEDIEQELVPRLAAAGRGPEDPIERMERGCQAFLDACLDPVVRQIVLVDTPAVLGWRRWRDIDTRYGFGLLQAGLRSAARAGRIPTDLLEERGHLLLASLMEAALLVGEAADPVATREAVGRVVSEQIWGLAGETPPLPTPAAPPVLGDRPATLTPTNLDDRG